MLQKFTVIRRKVQSIAVHYPIKIFQTQLDKFHDFSRTSKDHLHFQGVSMPWICNISIQGLSRTSGYPDLKVLEKNSVEFKKHNRQMPQSTRSPSSWSGWWWSPAPWWRRAAWWWWATSYWSWLRLWHMHRGSRHLLAIDLSYSIHIRYSIWHIKAAIHFQN